MDESPRPHSGWSFAKVIGVIVGLIGMVGFGLCSLCGMIVGIGGGLGEFWFLVVAGMAMTALSVWLVVTMFRKAREKREELEARDRGDHPDLRDL